MSKCQKVPKQKESEKESKRCKSEKRRNERKANTLWCKFHNVTRFTKTFLSLPL